MRIKSIDVSNFRALRNATLNFSPTTALIGENNSGKSAFLNAMELFFSGSPRIKRRDFSDEKIEVPIDITLHFGDLTPDDHKEFDEYLLNGDLIVTRRFYSDGSKDSGKYFVSARVNKEFAECRSEEKATAKRAAYKKLQEKYSLPDVKSADEIEGHLINWEIANPNSDALEIIKTSSFKGWTNVASGKLKQKTDFILIRAVEDATENIQENKNSPVKNLVNAIARQAIENSSAFKQFIDEANAKIAELTDPAKVPVLADISGQLTGILTRYYKDSEINATWEPITQIQPNFPTATLEIIDNDFSNSIDGVGHGLQRAIILTVLQFMAQYQATQNKEAEIFAEPQSDIILAIEEPEIYQHPIKQRLFAKLLNQLAQSFNESTGIRIQTIYVTHSPLMISLSQCEAIRMVRRVKTDKGNNVLPSEISLADCSRKIAVLSGLPPEQAWSAHNFGAKLHIFRPEIAEGFFGNRVVLVEGVGDQAVLEAWYKIADRDPHAEGIVIVGVGGKNNLAKVITVFDALQIPCYWVFDNDKSKGENEADSIASNRLLQKLAGWTDESCSDWPAGVFDEFASWDCKIEKYVRLKAGAEKFDAARAEIAQNYNVDANLSLKFPASSSAILIRLREEGVVFDELDGLIAAIDKLVA
ncbi:MAG: ATP-dependent endonuclease [Afipia sp.]|jgi:predicted ATP-dependent endonuclease of OLD family|nr:ATP-dependent endonuclease [Afipia sp.]WIG50203.1 MAG: hypothetical protein OJF48_001120 [Afipia sp.]